MDDDNLTLNTKKAPKAPKAPNPNTKKASNIREVLKIDTGNLGRNGLQRRWLRRKLRARQEEDTMKNTGGEVKRSPPPAIDSPPAYTGQLARALQMGERDAAGADSPRSPAVATPPHLAEKLGGGRRRIRKSRRKRKQWRQKPPSRRKRRQNRRRRTWRLRRQRRRRSSRRSRRGSWAVRGRRSRRRIIGCGE